MMAKRDTYRKTDLERKLAQSPQDPVKAKHLENLRRFDEYNEARGVSVGTRQNYVRMGLKLSSHLDKPFDEVEKKDMIQVMAAIDKKVKAGDMTEGVRNLFIICTKRLYQWLHDLEKGEYPDVVRWIQKKPAPMEERLKRNGELLTPGEIEALIRAAGPNARDRAIVTVLWECGCRASELTDLRIQDVEVGVTNAKIRFVNGTKKTRESTRIVPIEVSIQPLRDWVNQHPRSNDPQAKLFCSLSSPTLGKELSYTGLRGILVKLANRAGIRKSVNPHSFRHLRATELCQKLREPLMRQMFGWSASSRMPEVYEHVSDESLSDEYRALHGKAPAKRESMLSAPRCKRCGEESAVGDRFCRTCSHPLRAEDAEKLEKLDDPNAIAMKLSSLTPEKLALLQEILPALLEKAG